MNEITATEVQTLVKGTDTAIFMITEFGDGTTDAALRMTVGSITADLPVQSFADSHAARAHTATWVGSLVADGWATA